VVFDLIVLGGGPAGIVAATAAAGLGKNVALVDNHHELGGAGANTGTVPSKTLRETALALSGMRSRNLHGVDLSLRREATVSDFLRHERNVKARLNLSLAKRMETNRTTVFDGTGTFEDPHTIRVCLKPDSDPKEVRIAGNHILIATGSSPLHPPGIPFGLPEVYDSDSILELDRLPGTLAVLGAGVIGSEYACTFAALGSKVHVIDGRNVLLSFLDSEVSRALTMVMERDGIVFHWNEHAQCSGCEPGTKEAGKVALQLSSGERLVVDAVLVAAGRKSNIDALNLEAAGITPGERGLILVDEHFRTTVPHIYAAGDVIGFPALASTSMDQGRRVIRHAFGPESPGRASSLLPTGVYTIPEVSMIGETEESLRRANVDYVVGRGSYGASARGRIIGDLDGFLKLLFRRDDMKLLGVHAMGEQATELVHVGLMVMLAGGSADIFEEACFNIPTLGALYKVAALDALTAAAATVITRPS
jgi:NAD(P) transhydrogenase